MASVKALIVDAYGSGENRGFGTLLAVEIADEDYRNEPVIAQALRDLADKVEQGAGFEGFWTR